MKRLSILILTLLLAITAKAKPVSHEEALTLASAFLGQTEVTSVPSVFKHLHIFNSETGFVIISGDDSTIPVIAYSLEHPFTNAMAESTYQWLLDCDSNVRAAMASGMEPSDELKAVWDTFRKEGRLPVVSRSSVGPLIDTKWGQRPPYNMYCPSGCLTGCVATVMAQIMRYWGYPAQGTGSHAYEHPDYGELSVNFGATSYDWTHMPITINNNSSDASKRAVATLMYHCGVSVDMNYGTDASSAPSAKVIGAMTDYFGYSSSMSLERQSNYTNNQWKQLLVDELNAMRPVYYVGQDRVSAHAFICDGYDEQGYFHINWGWSGVNDGYYAIGALNPSGYPSFNVNNYAIIGIEPAGGGVLPIPAPVNLDVYPDGNSLVIEWEMSLLNSNYTFKVSRDGELIASGLTAYTYTDRNVASGSYTYRVWAVLNGAESNKKAEYEIEVASISVESANPLQGTATGSGLAEIGFGHKVTAIPNPGFVFYSWLENGEVVSTDAEFMFCVTGDCRLTACFSGTGIEEDEEPYVVYKTEIFTLNGTRVKRIEDGAKGVYLLRLTTDKGIITKKVIF